MYPCLKKGFIGVNIANPGDKGLIQQQGFDSELPSIETLQEFLPVITWGKGLEPELPKFFGPFKLIRSVKPPFSHCKFQIPNSI